MCQLFHCFAWALDFIQRLITFCLACVLCCVVCFGVVVALVAGIAYGYNYSLSEFLNLKSPEITVYMRRGQFYDKPDFEMDKSMVMRRSMGEEGDTFSNKSLDYPEANVGGDAKSLPEAWDQIKDARKYAEALTKFSKKPDEWGLINQPEKRADPSKQRDSPLETPDTPPARAPPLPTPPIIQPFPKQTTITIVSETKMPILYLSPKWEQLGWNLTPTRTTSAKRVYTPPYVPTETLSESPQILMRDFQPLNPGNEAEREEKEFQEFLGRQMKQDYPNLENKQRVYNMSPKKTPLPNDNDGDYIGQSKKLETDLNMRQWDEAQELRTSYVKKSTSKSPSYIDDVVDLGDDPNIDEDNVVYKPV